MKSERATLEQLIQEYTTAVNEASRFVFLVRDTDLQIEQIETLTTLKNRIKGFKRGATSARDELGANRLFHMQCGLNAEICFLKVWVQLKKGDYFGAWDNLIDAEEYVSIALRASDEGTGLDDFLDRLRRVEDVIFPGFAVYNSWGAVISGGTCTVCDRPFNDCEHIEGMVYWGRLCVRINPKLVDMDHVAMVEQPQDRRCIITEITTDDGYYRDYMTWRKTKKAEEKREGTLGSFVSKIFSNKLLEVD